MKTDRTILYRRQISSFSMFKSIIVYLVFLGIITGLKSDVHAERQFPNWILNIGVREVPVVKLNDISTTNGTESLSPNSLLIPASEKVERTQSQKFKKPLLPLVDLDGSFYYFGTYFKANFFKAMQFCREHGMTLLSIETSEENTRILNYVISNENKIDHFWTSGSDLGEEGKFVWLATGKSFNFTYWSPPQPDNGGNTEHCMVIWKAGDKHYTWNDIPCTNDYNFICEVEKCCDFCIN